MSGPSITPVEMARATTPRGEVVLRRRPSERAPDVLELRVNGVFVMDTRETSTEQALARLALDQTAAPRNVLIGGLGLGFTLRAVLDDVRVERVSVAEIEGPVIEWMRSGVIPHGPALLADQRVSLVNLDVADAVREVVPESIDVVLLDVDNGPDYLVHEHNAAVYGEPFLQEVSRLLTPVGVTAVWSQSESPELAETMARVFEHTTALDFEVALQDRTERYWLHVGHA